MKNKLLCPNCGHHIADFIAPASAPSRGHQLTPLADDTVGEFIKARCQLDKTRRLETKEFRAAYLQWCEEEGHHPLAPQTMGRALATMSHIKSVASNGKRYYTGITFA